VKREVSAVLPDPVDLNDINIYTTHDGAKNMMKASEKMNSLHAQHCVAHILHLLLMTDAIEQVNSIMVLLDQCKKIVRTLNFKGSEVEAAKKSEEEEKSMQKFMAAIEKAYDVSSLNEQFSPTLLDMDLEEASTSYRTLKNSNDTQWNSSLVMIDSILNE
jgi:hypothetical protein